MDGQQNNQNGWNGSEAPRTYGEDTKMYQNRQNAPQQPNYGSGQNPYQQPNYGNSQNAYQQPDYGNAQNMNQQPNYGNSQNAYQQPRISSRITETGRAIRIRRSSTDRYPMFCAIFSW